MLSLHLMCKRIFLFLAFCLIAPELAQAVATEVGNVSDFGEFTSNVWEWASQLIFGISVITIMCGGVVLMFAGGQENVVSTAKSIIYGAIISSLIVVFSALVQNVLHRPTANLDDIPKLSDTTLVVQNVIFTILGVVGGLAILSLIFNAVILMLAGGDSSKEARAKRGIKFSILGLAIALLAMTILKTVLAPF